LVIYIHGGGFTAGDKSGTHTRNTEDIREFLQSCVAYVEDPVYGLEDPSGEELTSFLIRHLR
jgi:hypothetical protein